MAELERRLSTWDGVSITVGSVIGTGVFLVASDIARAIPHGGMLLLVWLAGGLLSLAGALSYAELGAMYPRAGGIYHYLREAYGPLVGFLYGWTCFLVIMSGGIAAIAVGFGEYLGSFVPALSTQNVLLRRQIGDWHWSLSGGQLAAAGAIVVLTAINHIGLRQGAATQNLMTVLKIGALVALAILGLLVAAPADPGLTAALPASGAALWSALGVAMIAVLWTYDGWYGLTFSAGEMRDPGRSLPRGLIGGTVLITVLYLLANYVYLRAVPIERIAAEPRIAETAATVLFGALGGKLLAAAVVISSFGCLAATILYSSRIYHPMAEDGVFFPALAKIDPVHRVPVRSLWAQSAWAVLLTLSGTYSQLFTYVIFAAVLFHVLAGAAVFVLRRKRPELARPYRVWGYPVVPVFFIAASLWIIGNTAIERPVESLLGLGIIVLGLPAYAYWRRRSA